MGKNLKGKELGKGLSQRADGRYQARCSLHGISIQLYGDNLTKLRKEFEQAKRRAFTQMTQTADAWEYGIPKPRTLGDWYEEWFETFKKPILKHELSVVSYHNRMKNTYLKLLGSKKLTAITQFQVQTGQQMNW